MPHHSLVSLINKNWRNQRWMGVSFLVRGSFGVWTQGLCLPVKSSTTWDTLHPAIFFFLLWLFLGSVLKFLPGTDLGLWSSYLCLLVSGMIGIHNYACLMYWDGLSSNYCPLNLCLQCSWNYRHASTPGTLLHNSAVLWGMLTQNCIES
jgi:hypothetical protein